MRRLFALACLFLLNRAQGLVPVRSILDIADGEPVPRIVGGQDADRGEAPQLATIKIGDNICSGSVIGRRWILTIIYCVLPGFNNLNDIHITVGMDNLDTDMSDAQFTTAEQLIPLNHTQFVLINAVLIKTRDVLRVGSKYIGVMDIVDEGVLNAIKSKDRRCFVYGRGIGRSDDGAYVPVRQTKKLSVRYTKCKNVYRDEYPFAFNGLSCFKSNDPDSYMCAGDDGNSIVCRHQGKWYLTGMAYVSVDLDGCPAARGAVSDLDMVHDQIQDIIDND